MLGIPGQTAESLRRSIDFCTQAGVCHISAYLLKIEEGTPFAQRRASLVLPNEDTVCDLYEQACEELEAAGFQQYEISNFARHGFESRHNLKYWNAEEYLEMCIRDSRRTERCAVALPAKKCVRVVQRQIKVALLRRIVITQGQLCASDLPVILLKFRRNGTEGLSRIGG